MSSNRRNINYTYKHLHKHIRTFYPEKITKDKYIHIQKTYTYVYLGEYNECYVFKALTYS